MSKNSGFYSRLSLDSLELPNNIPYIGVESSTFWTIVIPTMAGIVLGLMYSSILGVGIGFFGLVCGVLLVYVCPSYMSIVDWYKTWKHHQKTPSLIVDLDDIEDCVNDGFEVDPDRTIFEEIDDSLPFFSFTLKENARDYTQIEKFYPINRVIERTDGKVVGGLEIIPEGRDFIDPEKIDKIARQTSRFINDNLDFPVSLYVTTESFNFDEHIKKLEGRVDDIDNDVFRAAVVDYIEKRPKQIEQNGAELPRFYLFTSVGTKDILKNDTGEKTTKEKLSTAPIFGFLFQIFSSVKKKDTSEKRQQIKKLDNRLERIQKEWFSNSEIGETKRLDIEEWIILLKRFWQGEKTHIGKKDSLSENKDTGKKVFGSNGFLPQSPAVRGGNKKSIARSNRGIESLDVDDRDIGSDDLDIVSGGIGEKNQMVLDKVSVLEKKSISPEVIDRRSQRDIVCGGKWRKVLFGLGWPDIVEDGLFERFFTRPDLQYDVSIHISPRDPDRARREAERLADSLKAEADIFGRNREFQMSDKIEKSKKVAKVRDEIKDGQKPCRVSFFVSVRGDTKDELIENTRKIKDVLSDPPTHMDLRVLVGKQAKGLVSVSPIGYNSFKDDSCLDPSRLVLGRGVGGIFSSIQRSLLIEEGGVELGEHCFNGSQIIKDPFVSETNYNWVVLGDSGSGKSYNCKLNALRTVATQKDTLLVILDPLKGFLGLNEALDGEKITIGGNRNLNPLEIRETPEDLRNKQDIDIDPLSEKIKNVMKFFDNFTDQQNIDLGEKRSTLNIALNYTYKKRKGITHDLDTHKKESPTISGDLLAVLEDMAENPEKYISRTEKEKNGLQRDATFLLRVLRPFEDGHYKNLAKETSFDIKAEENDVIYIDFSQQEANQTGGGGLMMQLVFSLVYERVKETSKNAILLVDEARYLMRNTKSLAFLEQAVRHSRHYNTSIRFITQELKDFFNQENAEAIINNSSVKVFHRLDEIRSSGPPSGEMTWQEFFDLNNQQARYIEEAATGKNGYSEALIEIDKEWYPLQVFGTPNEHTIVDFDETQNIIDNLPRLNPKNQNKNLKKKLSRKTKKRTLKEVMDKSYKDKQNALEDIKEIKNKIENTNWKQNPENQQKKNID